mmetsp:Transcript_8164/g.23336  ORF Transcript_8164/g.23336 Transcript_8164/m.23336 type:complete len:230 (+) Transcript_8164:489-1178(+)
MNSYDRVEGAAQDLAPVLGETHGRHPVRVRVGDGPDALPGPVPPDLDHARLIAGADELAVPAEVHGKNRTGVKHELLRGLVAQVLLQFVRRRVPDLQKPVHGPCYQHKPVWGELGALDVAVLAELDGSGQRSGALLLLVHLANCHPPQQVDLRAVRESPLQPLPLQGLANNCHEARGGDDGNLLREFCRNLGPLLVLGGAWVQVPSVHINSSHEVLQLEIPRLVLFPQD